MCCYRKRIGVQIVANDMPVFGYRHGSSIPPVAAFQQHSAFWMGGSGSCACFALEVLPKTHDI